MSETTKLKSFVEYFYEWEETKANEVFLRQPFGKEWKTLTWQEVGDQARRMVTALRAMGIEKGAHVGIFSKNCYHWIMADIALALGGYVSTPFYPNLSSGQLNEVLKKSDCEALFVGKLEEWDEPKKGIPEEIKIIRFPHYKGNKEVVEGESWDDLIAAHEPMQGHPKPNLKDLWTILFTSGTTGTPKGVMLDYNGPALQMANEREHKDLGMFEGKEHRYFSFLPLNHIAERMIVEGAAILSGGSISFAESLETFTDNLKDTQPTMFLAVPRIWTKFQMGILKNASQKKLNRLFKIPFVSGAIKNKIRKALGLNEARVILTAAAPTPDALKDWFEKLGLPLREVYGMTETCGGATLMPKDNMRSGTVGKPLTNVEVKIEEGTGQLMVNMPWRMLGYYKDPEKTAEVLRDGWICTGDKCELDRRGFVKIVGRVTDTFKTAKGKYVSPVPIEELFSRVDIIEQLCLIGLGLPQTVLVVVLSELANDLDKKEIDSRLKDALKDANKKLHKHEKISTIIVTNKVWAPENGLLTPTLKVKRQKVNEEYLDKCLGWHEDDGKIIWES